MCKENFHAKTEKPKVWTCKRTRQDPKLCPGIAILEAKLTTGAVDQGGEGKIFKEFLFFYLLMTRDSSISKSINSSLDHHKDYLYLVFC